NSAAPFLIWTFQHFAQATRNFRPGSSPRPNRSPSARPARNERNFSATEQSLGPLFGLLIGIVEADTPTTTIFPSLTTAPSPSSMPHAPQDGRRCGRRGHPL